MHDTLTPTAAAALLQTLRHGSAVEIDPRQSLYFAPCISCEHCEESAPLIRTGRARDDRHATRLVWKGAPPMMATLQPDLFAPVADEPQDAADEPEIRTETKPAAVLYRCRPCERRTNRPHVWRQTLTRTATHRRWWSTTVRRHIHAAQIEWTDNAGRRSPGEQPPHAACPGCNRPTFGQAINGRFNAAKRCDARCIYAKGPNCECACGGANHGAGHAR